MFMMMFVLIEVWCGDVVQVILVLNKIVEMIFNFFLWFILRDEYFDIMDVFFINGGCFILKIIFLKGVNRMVIGSWGFRFVVVQ